MPELRESPILALDAQRRTLRRDTEYPICLFNQRAFSRKAFTISSAILRSRIASASWTMVIPRMATSPIAFHRFFVSSSSSCLRVEVFRAFVVSGYWMSTSMPPTTPAAML